MKQGMFVVIEGVDGCGKTTQVKLLKELLEKDEYYKELGFDGVVSVSEPGHTYVGQGVRSIVKSGEDKDFDPLTEILLFSAARRRLILETVKPALESNKLVISDRYYLSTIVYQISELNEDDLLQGTRIIDVGKCKLEPDLTVILSPPPEVCALRRDNGEADRLDGNLKTVQARHAKYKAIYEDGFRMRSRLVDLGLCSLHNIALLELSGLETKYRTANMLIKAIEATSKVKATLDASDQS